MKSNVGGVDRGIRFILGIILLLVLFFVESGWRYIGLLGFVLLFTAIFRWCPLYLPFGINMKK